MYAHAITVEPDDIDHMGHVNNAVYLRWVQDAVTRYWEAVAPADAVAQHLWVALKHEISYLRPAFLEDGLVAEVIAERVHGARSFFTTGIRRGEDLLAEIRSSWCCLDSATLRPARLARDVAARFLPGQPARQAATHPGE
jgi:acyl-CoA thioester hydrolase